jgi:membrane peptidoglycan carboxypeptidase
MVREYLVSKYGEDAVQNGGYKIITTLDYEVQKIAEEVVSKYGAINEQRYRARNAALTAVEPSTGKVLAMVGSRDYFNLDIDGNFNVATARRQPGSAFKPFAYAEAFKKGYPDSTILFDLKTEFNPNCHPGGNDIKDNFGSACYNPQNYDGLFRGPVTMRQGLAQSLNIPSVKTLYLAGIKDTADLAENMGISTLEDRQRFGLSLVLGGAEVKLVDMVSAYGVFANDGIRNPWYFIDRIELPNGNILEEHRPDPDRVIDSKISRLITDVLSDNDSRAPVFGFTNSLYIPGMNVAAKTGTTQENKDAWVVGYTTAIAAGVWTGNNDNQPMTAAGAGISAAGPMWNEFMRRTASLYNPGSFTQPEPVFESKTMLNGQYSDPSLGIHSILYYVDVKNPLGPMPGNPVQDPQFENWEWSIRQLYGF